LALHAQVLAAADGASVRRRGRQLAAMLPLLLLLLPRPLLLRPRLLATPTAPECCVELVVLDRRGASARRPRTPLVVVLPPPALLLLRLPLRPTTTASPRSRRASTARPVRVIDGALRVFV
jgi:hypothetical protein